MQEMKYDELERRASETDLAEAFEKLKVNTRVKDVIEEMKSEGKALVLTHEEEEMLRSFRRFKLRMRKSVEVFKWQTAKLTDAGIEIISETANILHPNEVA